MKFLSTEGGEAANFCEAVLGGKCADGGLYVPSSFPRFDAAFLRELSELDVADRAYRVLYPFMEELDRRGVRQALKDVYADMPVTKIEDGLFVCELWHGPAMSDADMDYKLFDALIWQIRAKLNVSGTPVLVEGAQGARALACLRNYGGDAVLLYDASDVDELTRKQLASAVDRRKLVIGLKGEGASVNRLSKNLCRSNADFMKFDGLNILAVLAKLTPIVSGYVDLVSDGEVELGDEIVIAVPAGDLAFAMAALYAKKCGLPISRIVLAQNSNRFLQTAFEEGVLKVPHTLYRTSAPEMDMLVPLGLERLLYELCGGDTDRTAELMAKLTSEGEATLDDDEAQAFADNFYVDWLDDKEIADAIYAFFDLDDCILDPHTAATAGVYNGYSVQEEDESTALIIATADPYKYPITVLGALGSREKDPYRAISRLGDATALECPSCLDGLMYRDENRLLLCEEEALDRALKFALSRGE